MAECLCHKESGSHEVCCGHEGGRNPDCPQHGDGWNSEAKPWPEVPGSAIDAGAQALAKAFPTLTEDFMPVWFQKAARIVLEAAAGVTAHSDACLLVAEHEGGCIIL